jgi:Fe-S oxidoreductase
MYVLLLPTFGIAAYGFYRRITLWRRGLPANRFDKPNQRLMMVLKHALGQQRTMRERYAAVFHTSVFAGFIVLTIATIVVMLDADFGVPIMRGAFYLYFQSFVVDVFGAITLIGVAIASLRRFILKPKKLVYTEEATWILTIIFLIAATGFLLEGWRIAATNDPWGSWSPFGNLIARFSRRFMGIGAMRNAHLAFWWGHALLVFGFIAWTPYTKMFHVFTAPLNIYAAPLIPIGATLKSIDFEKAETLGVNSLSGYTWKDLLDLDACTECGRCTNVCPANAVGKSLSPRDIILDLRNVMHANPAAAFGLNGNSPLPIINSTTATSPDALWSCTTCGACMESCPVFIEQMPKIVDMRRFLVMEQSDFPETMQAAITSLESRSHPFRGTQSTRTDWTEGLGIKTGADIKDAEVILWVGCGGALIERNQKATRATAELLKMAGVNFAVLGKEEKCSGDPARRIGNEFLFQTLAKSNIDNLNRYDVKTVITACPHCFNSFKNEYPEYGGSFDVYHHSQYLAKLVDEGKLSAASALDKKITYHDPCYLGRQNGEYEAPRQLVQLSAKSPVIEMQQNREKGFCCGGGGGMSFVEEPADKRVNRERARQALDTGADVVAVGCPFCMTMMEDGINSIKGERDVRVMDIAELLLAATKN